VEWLPSWGSYLYHPLFGC